MLICSILKLSQNGLGAWIPFGYAMLFASEFFSETARSYTEKVFQLSTASKQPPMRVSDGDFVEYYFNISTGNSHIFSKMSGSGNELML